MALFTEDEEAKRREHMKMPFDFRIMEARRCRRESLEELEALRKAHTNRHRECPKCQATLCESRNCYDFEEDYRDILNEINFYTHRILRMQWERNYIARLTRKAK